MIYFFFIFDIIDFYLFCLLKFDKIKIIENK